MARSMRMRKLAARTQRPNDLVRAAFDATLRTRARSGPFARLHANSHGRLAPSRELAQQARASTRIGTAGSRLHANSRGRLAPPRELARQAPALTPNWAGHSRPPPPWGCGPRA